MVARIGASYLRTRARRRGSKIAASDKVRIHTISATPTDAPSMEHPDKIKPVAYSIPFAKDLTLKLEPYSVMVAEIAGE